ncbi:preprotein translocase subunit SecD [Chloroflexota bacterium]
MLRKNILVLILILMIFGSALWAILPLDGERLGRQGINLGLDLVGGVHLVYEAQFPEDASAEDRARDMERALATIERRIDKYGVAEPVIQKLGADRILVQLPGFTDIEVAKRQVEATGFLEFRRVELNKDGQPVYLSDYLESAENEFFEKGEKDKRIFVDAIGTPVVYLVKNEGILQFVDEGDNPVDIETLELETNSLLSWIPARGNNGTPLTGDLLKEAIPTISQEVTGAEYQVSITWNEQGGKYFDEIAKRLYDSGEYGTPQRALGIFLDDTLLSSPQILQPSYHGSGVITGSFTQERVTELANWLESGALPMPLNKPPPLPGEDFRHPGSQFH